MQTKAEIVQASAESRIGDPYVFGAWGEECTPANRKRRARSAYPTIVGKCQVLSGKKTTCEGCKYQGRHIYDCRGFTYRCLADAGIKISGEGATSQYADKTNWAQRGTTDDMPNCLCCIFMDDGTGTKKHTAFHIKDGRIIHCSGEVKTGIIDRSWTHYGVPAGLYDVIPKERLIVMSILKRGSKGENVIALQQDLAALGYPCGAVDGKYGLNTETAVRKFQADHGLTVDGIAGPATQTAIADCLKATAIDEQLFGGGTKEDETLEQRIAALEQFAEEVRQRLFGTEG